MSCSKDKVMHSMVSRGLISQDMKLDSTELSPRLKDYISNITNLAKSKYKVDMGPLFEVKARVSDHAAERLGLKPENTRLQANENAFRAIDESPAMQENRDNTNMNQEMYQHMKDYQDPEILQEIQDVNIPKNLPPLNLKCI